MACLTLGGQEDHRAKRSLPGHYKSTNAPPACRHASRSARTSDTAHAVPASRQTRRMRAESGYGPLVRRAVLGCFIGQKGAWRARFSDGAVAVRARRAAERRVSYV